MKEGRKPVIIEATLPPTPGLLSSAKAGSEKLQRHCIGLDLLWDCTYVSEVAPVDEKMENITCAQTFLIHPDKKPSIE